MGNTGDGLRLLLGLGRRSVEQTTDGPPAQVGVYVHDLESDQNLIGLRRPGVHGYEYQPAPPEGADGRDKK